MRWLHSIAMLAALGLLASTAFAAVEFKFQDAVRVNDIIGMTVKNDAGENLGQLKDLVVDTSTGKICYAAVASGGFLGIGEKLFAVPFGDLKLTTSGEAGREVMHLVLDVRKDAIENAPTFDKSNWPNFADKNFTDKIDKYFSEHRQAGRAGGTLRR